MVNEIITGVSLGLNGVFGDAYEIYKDGVEQDLKEPCFFIAILQPQWTPQLNRRSKLIVPLDVHYFPLDGTNNGDMINKATDILTALECITLPNGDTLRGLDKSFQIIDGVLHCFVTYTVYLVKQYTPPEMESVDSDVGVTKG